MTYKQVFDKVTSAYIKGELNPYISYNCVFGNIFDNSRKWRAECFDLGDGNYSNFSLGKISSEASAFIKKNSIYTPLQVHELEKLFLETLDGNLDLDGIKPNTCSIYSSVVSKLFLYKTSLPKYEDALFIAMETVLEAIKQVHIEYGEDVDAEIIPKFEKRQLVNS